MVPSVSVGPVLWRPPRTIAAIMVPPHCKNNALVRTTKGVVSATMSYFALYKYPGGRSFKTKCKTSVGLVELCLCRHLGPLRYHLPLNCTTIVVLHTTALPAYPGLPELGDIEQRVSRIVEDIFWSCPTLFDSIDIANRGV